MTQRIEMKVADFRAALKAQGVPPQHVAVICPACKTVQSKADFVAAGMTEEKAEGYIGFSCLGRFTGAPGPRAEPDGKPCNWTLGGLLQIHDLVVIDNDGTRHRMFAVATPEQAQAHMKGGKA